MKRLYLRCNEGHLYSTSVSCPFDGWSDADTASVLAIASALPPDALSIEALRFRGAPQEGLRRAMVIDFPDEDCSFLALAAAYVFVGGETVLAQDVDDFFHK